MTENIHIPAGGDPVEGYITKIVVAQRVKKTVRCIEGWMKAGLIPYYKIGRSTLFKWSEIEEHLNLTCRVCRRNPHYSSSRTVPGIIQ